ncbi:MAG: Fic family protein [Polaribacter sp.]|jgi:Fic family protein
MNNKHLSLQVSIFQGRKAPEESTLVGYGAIIEGYELGVHLPQRLALISEKRRSYETDRWIVHSSKNRFTDSLYGHLVFALKYEGINLLVLKILFKTLGQANVLSLVSIEPTGQYSRKLWFLYEWLMGEKLDLPDMSIKKAVPLINEKLQYAIKGKSSPRHRIINNLPGTPDYCPLVHRTAKLDAHIAANIGEQKSNFLNSIHKDVLQRASAFLLLKDSKASFSIEGESPKSKRAARWGQAIGQAGAKPLSQDELLRLQQLVIENSRFIKMGFRDQGGFVGEHDRTTGEPLPNHISARHENVGQLIDGLIASNELLLNDDYDAVLAAAQIAFGFVFIHPFVDGNGRIHRYIIHHILARKGLTPQGVIFPVSASILDHIDDYRKVLESYSLPLLDNIEWKPTRDNNVEVLNETIDLYRYFDATKIAEFLYDCVNDTIVNIIPNEVRYLQQYDQFKRYLDDDFEMPDKMVALLVRLLEQNEGKLSKRAKEKEFPLLSGNEVTEIETQFQAIFEIE